MSENVLMSADDIRRAIVRIAHEVVEQNQGCRGRIIVGMRTRGVPLARRLAGAIGEFEREEIAVGSLDIGLYRDDLPARGAEVDSLTVGRASDASGDCKGHGTPDKGELVTNDTDGNNIPDDCD